MSKQALISLPLLALTFFALVGCPDSNQANDPPTKGASGDASDAGHKNSTTTAKSAYGPGAVKARPGDELFVGWPKPKLAIVITGKQEGYLEPCGCGAGESEGRPSSAAGILDAVDSKRLADGRRGLGRHGRPIRAASRNQVPARGRSPGHDGLRRDRLWPQGPALPDGLRTVVANDQDHRYVSANVNVLKQTQPYRVVEAGGKRSASRPSWETSIGPK